MQKTSSAPSLKQRLPGYHGQVLFVDAATQSSRIVSLPPQLYEKYVGGSSLASLLLTAASRYPPTDPLESSSPIVFAFSPLVGSPITTSAKFSVVSRSPLTNRLNDSMAGSRFAIQGKRSGFDAIVIVGASESPSIVLIDESGARFEPAESVWGKSTTETESHLRNSYGSSFVFSVIGPAGERLVRFATLSHDGRHAGRGGSGAVLGSKRIKAIGVSGRSQVQFFDPERLSQWARKLASRSWGPATAKYRELGTLSNLLTFNRLQMLPSRNFQQHEFAPAATLSPESLERDRAKVRSSCAACTIGCEHAYQSSELSGPPIRVEYESMFALGPLCGVSDASSVLQAARLCDELGMDTISAGGTLAFAMECRERGWFPECEWRFGEGSDLIKAIEEIGTRQGLGDRLAHGTLRLAQQLGHHTLPFAAQVKGLELPGYDPRKLKSLAVGLAVCARGADHNRSSAYEADLSETPPESIQARAAAALASENRASILDALILCKFLRGCFDPFDREVTELLHAAIGGNDSPTRLHDLARRTNDIKKWFNQRCGWTAAEDRLPDRFFQPSEAGVPGIDRKSFTETVRAYYLARGWTADGELMDSNEIEADIELARTALID